MPPTHVHCAHHESTRRCVNCSFLFTASHPPADLTEIKLNAIGPVRTEIIDLAGAGRGSGGGRHQLADSAKYAVEHDDKRVQLLRRDIAKQELRETVLILAHRRRDLGAPWRQRYERRTAVGRVSGARLRMLATLLPPTAGEARVAGFDLRRQPERVRRRIGWGSREESTAA